MSSIRVYPSNLQPALVDGYTITPGPNGRQRPRDQGELRIRPRWTTVHDTCELSWDFLQSDFDIFEHWYEYDLQAGTLDFDIQVHEYGSVDDLTWYTAKIRGEYTCRVSQVLDYNVRATVDLIENLGTLRIPPGIQATIGLNFGLTARTAPPQIAATIELNFGMQWAWPAQITQTVIELNFLMRWDVTPPPLPTIGPRETDAGDERETDDGTERETAS